MAPLAWRAMAPLAWRAMAPLAWRARHLMTLFKIGLKRTRGKHFFIKWCTQIEMKFKEVMGLFV
jgi:hypothetical protein